MKKKLISLLLLFSLLVCCLLGCGASPTPGVQAPISLTMWHVYGSQTKSPLNTAIDEFNSTVGKENGIIVNVVSVTSSSAIDKALLASANGEPGAEDLPDLFTAYPRVAEIVGKENLLVWNDYFTEEELQAFHEDFLTEGYFKNDLLMLPLAKSTEAFFLNKTLFDKFAKENDIAVKDLSTFDGLFRVANLYYDWSGGQDFTQINDYYHYALVGMKAYGSEFIRNGTLQLDDPAFEKIWHPLARAAIYGGLCMEDGYAAARWKTAEVISNIGSTADVLYQPEEVVYPDNSTESIRSISLPYPVFTEYSHGVVHRGGGLFALKSEDEARNRAACIFAKWITEKENNLRFTTSAGYLPVQTEAFELLFSSPDLAETQTYSSLYQTVRTTMEVYDLYSVPLYENASTIQRNFETNVKLTLKSAHNLYLERVSQGEDPEMVLEELAASSLNELKALSGC